MPTIRLTDATRLQREADRVQGVLLAALPAAGLPPGEIIDLLESRGLVYLPAELAAIRDELVRRGVIQIDP